MTGILFVFLIYYVVYILNKQFDKLSRSLSLSVSLSFSFTLLGVLLQRLFGFHENLINLFSFLWFIKILCFLTNISLFFTFLFVVSFIFGLFSYWKLKTWIGSFSLVLLDNQVFFLPFGFGWWVIKLFLAMILSRKEQQL